MSCVGRLELGNVLLGTVETEKSTRIGDKNNVVTFWVDLRATKLLIRRAVEKFFPGVEVTSVRTLIQARDQIRRGGRIGYTQKRKKAFVRLAAGHEIDLAEFE